jgi:hypothetical protein
MLRKLEQIILATFIIMLNDLTDALKRGIYLMARDVIDRHRRQTLADEAQEAQCTGDL